MSVTIANTDAQLSGKTLLTADANQTITGLKTYDRGVSAPLAIVSGAAKVTNLDADKLDGEEGTAFHDASLLTGTVAAISGGTGLSSYAIGDLLYASGTTTLAKLADVATGQVLVSGGVATAPAYSASPSITALTYTTNLKSTTALATPSALSATQATEFASTVSGASIMGFGTTNDVSLMNRAGTVVLGVGPNTTAVNIPGTLAVTGAVTGGTYNSQTISSAANFTGTVGVTGILTATGAIQGGGVETNTVYPGSGGNATFVGKDGYWAIRSDVAHDFHIDTYNGGAVLAALELTQAGLLTVSGFGTHSFSAGGTGDNALTLRNTTAGTTNTAYFAMGNDASAGVLEIYATSSTYTTAAPYFQDGVTIRSSRSGGLSIAATNASGAIRFYSGGGTERMRIDTAGHAVIGATSSYSGAMLELVSPNIYSTAYCLNCKTLADSPAPGYFISFSNSSNAVQGNIGNPTSTTTAYNTSSDIRLKNDLGVALTTILAGVVVHDFTWKRDGSAARGVFAQEVQSIAPFAVSVGKDHLTEDGTTLQHPWMVDYSKFVPDLIVGWQQHDTLIQQLAARIAALETKDH